jgi:hypothetical protein
LKVFPARREQFDAILAFVQTSQDAPIDPTSTALTFQELQLSLAQPLEVSTVPASAVFVASDGTSCVFISHSGARSPTPEVVDLQPTQSTELGVVYIEKGLAGTTVVANPYDALGEDARRCE